MITHIVAYNKVDKALGANNKLLWHVPEDLLHFKNQVKGKYIYMGVNTYKSLLPFLNKSSTFLKDSQIFVILNDKTKLNDLVLPLKKPINTISNECLNDLIYFYKNKNDFIIVGGGKTYEQFIPDKIIATEFDFPLFKEADSFYNIDLSNYVEINRVKKHCLKSNTDFHIVTYQKK